MKRLPKEDRAGLYITLIVHLVVLIILLAGRLGTEIYKENTFILDFTKVEQLEKLQRRLEFEQSVNDRLNELLSVSGGGYEYVHNVAVDRSALKDDRNSPRMRANSMKMPPDCSGNCKPASRLLRKMPSPR